ncbi:MAG: hypothetical protein AUK44_08320 [Porphyromonadaceae bacterium CG2_30_38_12]|nr:MAG: hypothetical protein AUK44_08320 [Porphyromonadaceae bacterium CG2_30_38_12]
MYTIFKYFHSFIAIEVILLLVLVIIFSIIAWLKKNPFTKISQTWALVAMIGAHIQFTIGLVLYFVSPLGWVNFSSISMKNSFARLLILEHPIMMILGAALITLGYFRAKNAQKDGKKYKYIAIFYSLGLIIILSRIPWSLWF